MLWSVWFVSVSLYQFILVQTFLCGINSWKNNITAADSCATVKKWLWPKKEVTPFNKKKNIAISNNLTILQQIVISAEPFEAFFRNSIFGWGTNENTAAIWDTLRPLPPTGHPKDYRKAQPKPEQLRWQTWFPAKHPWNLTSTYTFILLLVLFRSLTILLLL